MASGGIASPFEEDFEFDEQGNRIPRMPPPPMSPPMQRRAEMPEPPALEQAPPEFQRPMAEMPPPPPQMRPTMPEPPQMPENDGPPDLPMNGNSIAPQGPPPRPMPRTEAMYSAVDAALSKKGPPVWRQALGAVMSASPRLRGAASLVSGDAGRHREMERLKLHEYGANEEQQEVQRQQQNALAQQNADRQRTVADSTVSRNRAQETRANTPKSPTPIQYDPTKELVVPDSTDPTGFRTARKATPAATKPPAPARTIEGRALEIIDDQKLMPEERKARLDELVKTHNMFNPEKPITHFSTDDKGNVTAVSLKPGAVANAPGGRMQLGGIGKTKPAPAGPALQLSDSALDQAAVRFLKTGEMPPMGMGKDAGATRTRIQNRAAELDPDADIATNKGSYGADKSSLAALQKTRDSINAFEGTARKNLDQFMNVAQKTVDSGLPFANRVFRGGARVLGDRNAAQFEAARTVAFTEVAKVLNNPTSSAVLSDSARKEAEHILSGSYTVPQLIKVAELLKQDMENRKTETDRALQEIQNRMRSKKGNEGGGENERPSGSAGVVKWGRDAQGNPVRLSQ